jgi:hypothetical protein
VFGCSACWASVPIEIRDQHGAAAISLSVSSERANRVLVSIEIRDHARFQVVDRRGDLQLSRPGQAGEKRARRCQPPSGPF